MILNERKIRNEVDKITIEVLKKLPISSTRYDKKSGILTCEFYNGVYRISKSHTMVFNLEFMFSWIIVIESKIIENFIYRYPDVFFRPLKVSSTIGVMLGNVIGSIDKNFERDNWLIFRNTLEGLNHFKRYSVEVLQDLMLPLCEKLQDVRFMDSNYNSFRKAGIDQGHLKPLGKNEAGQIKRIVISKLAGSDNWKWLLEDLENQVAYGKSLIGTEKGSGLEMYDKLPPIIEEFKDYINDLEPLKNPNLFSEENAKV